MPDRCPKHCSASVAGVEAGMLTEKSACEATEAEPGTAAWLKNKK